MKKSLACGLALAALGFAAPMRAATVYVPVIEPMAADGAPLATQLWISNFGKTELPYATSLLQTDRAAAAPKAIGATVPAERAVYLDKVAAEGETGLLAIDASQELLVNAWVTSQHGGQTFYAGLPVISAETQLAAGTATYLNGVGRNGSVDVTQLALANLGAAAAECQVDVVDTDGTFVRSLGSVEVPAMSMSRFEDALGLRGDAATTAKVTCNQPFYAMAALVDSATSEVFFVNPAPAAEKASTPKPPAAGATITFFQPGIFHTATKADPKKILRLPVTSGFNATIVTADLDVIVGPWNPRDHAGAHNMLWFHRGKFRANTIANINAYGPNANQIKTVQNLDMPAHYYTGPKFHQQLTLGHTYHLNVNYNAVVRAVVFTISENGHVLHVARYDATAQNHEVVIPSTGLVAEFGNYDWQALPEVGSIGWSFANFRVTIVPK
jgi:hypothetical protein